MVGMNVSDGVNTSPGIGKTLKKYFHYLCFKAVANIILIVTAIINILGVSDE